MDRREFLTGSIACSLVAGAADALAQSGPLKIIFPFAAGGNPPLAVQPRTAVQPLDELVDCEQQECEYEERREEHQQEGRDRRVEEALREWIRHPVIVRPVQLRSIL